MERDDYLDDIHIRVLRVTEDLRAIQRELNCAAMEAPGDPELMEALTQLPEMESLQVLKSSVDQMRHFLWFYMQVMTNETEAGEKLRQSIRQHTAEDSVFSPGGCVPEEGALGGRHQPTALPQRRQRPQAQLDHSTETDFTRFRGRSTSKPRLTAT